MSQAKETSMIIELIRPHWLLALKALTLAIATSLLEGVAASLVMPIFQILGNDTTSNNLQLPDFIHSLISFFDRFPEDYKLAAVIITLFGVIVLKNTSLYFSMFIINKLKLKIGVAIRQKCIERFLKLELPFHSESRLGEILSYVNEQAQRSEILFSFVLEIVSESLIILVLLILLVSLSPTLTLLALICLAIVTLLLRKVINSVQIYGRKTAEHIEKFSSIVTEIITGIRVVKGFNAEPRELERVKQCLQERYEAELAAYKYNSAVHPLTETAGIFMLLLLLTIGSILFPRSQSKTLPFLLTYTLALLRILPRVSHLNGMRSQISVMSGSLEAIQNFLSRTAGLHLPDGTRLYEGIKSGLAFENVTFTFPSNSEPTLKEVSFQSKKGTVTAIVGPSGSGKSTLADLVMRFHDPDLGRVKIDGLALRELQVSSWRQSIAMVSQDTFLFNASVWENIAYGCPGATELEIIAAAKQAYAYEFIQTLPQGFDTILGNRGLRLSGGQRQRIAIARAILRDPDILILDEATSALDTNSEQIVQKALEEVSRDRTVLVIAHRLSTIEKADNIIVLCNGSVVEQGTHRELLKRQGKYWSLYKSQLPSDNHAILNN